MTRKEITRHLSQLLVDKFIYDRKYWASEVTFDYITQKPIRVDFMTFEPVNQMVGGIEKGSFTCYEVKSCKADFKSKNGHNFIGDKNYYVMPYDTFMEIKNLIPWRVGVYVDKDGKLECIKKAISYQRERPLAEMLFMMFRSGYDMSYICDGCREKGETNDQRGTTKDSQADTV